MNRFALLKMKKFFLFLFVFVLLTYQPINLSTLHAALSCDACHGYPPSYASAPNKMNSHPVHQSYGCATCHVEVTTGPYTITFATNHINGIYNVNASLGYDFTTSSCATPGCHGKTYWGGPALGCKGCHTSAVGTVVPRRAIVGEFSFGLESWKIIYADE